MHQPALNGVPLTKPSILFAEIVKGGKLEYTLGSAPDKNWGVK
jgi:hypothetical protein